MNYSKRRIAVIDIGTNSLLMLVAERNEYGKLQILAEESAVPRLGADLRQSGKISEESLARTLDALSPMLEKAKSLNAGQIVATATSAVREASNQPDVLTQLTQAVGNEVEVLPPNEEARLAYISVTTEHAQDKPSMVVDIGGGSTEVTWGIGHRFDGGRSLKVGVVKLLEGFFHSQPCGEDLLNAARKEVDDYLRRVTPLGKLEHYFGTAGTFTQLASIDLELKSYAPEKVEGHVLTEKAVSGWLSRVSTMSREEKLALPGIDPRRVDVLLPGLVIIERLFGKFGMESFKVYDRGVRFGKLFDLIRRFEPPIEFPKIN